MKSEEPLVSVIVPCYNHEKYVADCLEGLLNQTYRNIELLINDDVSTDRSFEIIESFRSRLEERFSCVLINRNKENLGTAGNINALMKAAKGKYIWAIASDDIMLSNAVMDNVQYCENDPECALCYSNTVYGDENTHMPFEPADEAQAAYRMDQPSGYGLTKQLLKCDFINGPTLFIPRTTIEKYGSFDSEFYLEDWEFVLRVSQQGKIVYLPKITVMYRIVNTSKSHSSNDEKGQDKQRLLYKESEKVILKYIKYADDNFLDEFYTSGLLNACGRKDDELVKHIWKKVRQNGYGKNISDKDIAYIHFMMSPLFKIYRYIQNRK